MQIRTRLTILFTLITATILLAFAAVIYYSATENREKEFYSSLRKEAITKANLLFNAKVDPQTLQDIYRNNRKVLNEVEVAVYNKGFTLLYHDASDIDFVKETPEMIGEIYHSGEIQFYQEDWQVIGIIYNFEEVDYAIIATAQDQYGYNKLDSLFNTILIVFIISILFIYVAGYYFSKRVFAPVKEMAEKAAQISVTNLDLRLSNNGNKDELAQLANTFNEMLNRLEHSFEAQKHFVSNISHELRTPLSAIITELELSINKDRDIEEYKMAIENALSDAKKLVRLSNSLLDLAKASYDTSEIGFKQVRVDELLLDARQQVQQANSEYKIDIFFENNFGDEADVLINGNEYLLKTAFVNLFENGCKFSYDNRSKVSISFEDKKIRLEFSDRGIGIPPADLENIFTPFYRGKNKTFADGNGIGLSLTDKIIRLHNGSISVTSQLEKETVFIVEFPYL